MLTNMLTNPTEPKFRRVRLSNRRFHSTVGHVAAAIDLLLALGFETDGEGEGASLVLRRDDPGLLWLGSSLVSDALGGN